MPVLQSSGTPPSWCELDYFEIVRLAPGEVHTFPRRSQKEKLIVGQGRCELTHKGQEIVAERGANLDLAGEAGRFEVHAVLEDAILIRMCGHWDEELGGSGLFGVTRSDSPTDGGDAVDYVKETNFDRHFHDCDEYWILFGGRGVAVSEGKHYPVQTGDCVATGMGHHHDFPLVSEPVSAVFFETTLHGQKRRGHLWEHTHGPAQPSPDRM